MDKAQYDLDESLIKACRANDMELVKYLLTSSDLSKHADINTLSHAEAGLPLRNAFSENNFELANFLLTSPELKEHANIHIAGDDIFRSAFFNIDNAVLECLVFDYKIERTDAIQKTLDNAKNTRYGNIIGYEHMKECVEKMFKIRSLNNELNTELLPTINDDNSRKPKL